MKLLNKCVAIIALPLVMHSTTYAKEILTTMLGDYSNGKEACDIWYSEHPEYQYCIPMQATGTFNLLAEHSDGTHQEEILSTQNYPGFVQLYASTNPDKNDHVFILQFNNDTPGDKIYDNFPINNVGLTCTNTSCSNWT